MAIAPSITHTFRVNESYSEGSSLNISCKATGIPVPDIMWIQKDHVKSFGKETAHLTFSNLSKADTGRYTCKAMNSIGSTDRELNLVVNYPATIGSITSSMATSWIGQTVTLKCVSDGVPTPTLTWYKPDGNQLTVTAKENTVDVKMSGDQDFGLYICNANNGFVPSVYKTVAVRQIKKPGSPIITSSAADTQVISLTVKWTAPADNGGSPITSYRVFILKGSSEIKNVNITDPGTTSMFVEGLQRDTEYTVNVFARNAVFVGPAGQKSIKTNLKGFPAAVTLVDFPNITKEVELKIKWNQPQNFGAPITKYTVYQRTDIDGDKTGRWTKIKNITDVSAREFNVKLEKGKGYEFVVTATNMFGESLKEERNIQRILVLGDVPAAIELMYEVKDYEIMLKWEEPQNNGGAIIQYSVYQRIVNDAEWTRLVNITDIAVRVYIVKVKKAKEYEFVVTATNTYGESSMKDKIKRIKLLKVSTKAPENQTGSSCDKTLLHIVYVSVILLLLIIIILLLIFIVRRMHSRTESSKASRKNECPRCGELIVMNPISVEAPDTHSFSMVQTDDSPNYASPIAMDGENIPLHPLNKSWEISREQVSIIKVIGKGAFSQVAKATVWNISDNQENTTVAVKMLKANAPDSDRKDLLSELELMKNLKPHPHVIKLIGCVTETDPLLVLIEYVPFGDLLGYLRKSRGLNDTYFKDPDVKPQTNLTAEQLMKFAWQVADGMFYLSSRKIIHRDLAARNVLVGEGEKCKVTDFGMARNVHQDDIYTKRSRGRLPVKWTAYEALLYATYTTQSDVWSYGVLLYEILTVGGSPYPGIHARQIARKLQEGFRMPKPKHVDNKLYQIMLKCWQENPTDRPTFAKLKDTMKEMERNHKTYVNLKQYDNSLYANVEDLTAE